MAISDAKFQGTVGFSTEDGSGHGDRGVHFVIFFEGGSLKFGGGLMMIVAISFLDVRGSPTEEWSKIIHGQLTGSGGPRYVSWPELSVSVEYFFVHVLL